LIGLRGEEESGDGAEEVEEVIMIGRGGLELIDQGRSEDERMSVEAGRGEKREGVTDVGELGQTLREGEIEGHEGKESIGELFHGGGVWRRVEDQDGEWSEGSEEVEYSQSS
jgi:hypothetical protein